MKAHSKPLLTQFARHLAKDTAGGFAVLAGVTLPVVLGLIGLSFDLNRGYQQRALNQRVADMAALGAALAYKTTQSTTMLSSAATDLVTANGLSGATTTAALVADYPSEGDKAVKVTVSYTLPFTLARLVGAGSSYTVTSVSYASLSSSVTYAAPCFLALSSESDALTVSGGATISAPSCSVAALGSIDNQGISISASDIISASGNVTVNWGALTVANSLRHSGSFNYPSWNGAVPAADKRVNAATTIADPWASSASLVSAASLLGSYTNVTALTDPATASTGAQNWTFDYTPSAAVSAFQTSAGNYTVPAGTYYIKALTVGGGVNVAFSSGSTIYIDKGFTNTGSSVKFGNSNIYVNGGWNSGPSGVSIGTGTLWIGSGAVSFTGINTKGAGDVTINAATLVGGGSTLTMGAGNHAFAGLTLGGGARVNLGAGNFTSTAGVAIDGDTELALGAGNVLLGKSGSGYSIYLTGSSRFFMGDGTFSASGGVNTGGGSRLIFGTTANHYINGDLTIAGSVLFGSGRYTVNGSFTNGTGGTTWPYTSTMTGLTYGNTLNSTSVSGYDMAGVDVSFILNGALNLAGGARTKLVAPGSTTSGGGIADMLVSSSTSNATNWAAGSANNFAGTIYLPNSIVTMSGGTTTLNSGQCFTLIANKISATGGASAGTACPSMSSSLLSSSSSIKLVL